MKGNWIRFAGALIASGAVLSVGAARTSAQAVNMTGAWAMEVTTETGTTTPSMTLEQAGDKLTGHYSSATLGEADITGTVNGNQVTISFSASLQGQEIPVTYVGTVDANGLMTGTIDLAGGLATGTFTARRSGE